MAFDEGILHFWPFAKYAVAFPRMSRSIFTRASSARKRLICICSGVTPALPLPSFSFPARFALTQFDSVCSTTPRLRAASAMLCPASTSRTASSLNSSVYLPRFPFLINAPFPLLKQFAKGYVLRGQAQCERGDSFFTPPIRLRNLLKTGYAKTTKNGKAACRGTIWAPQKFSLPSRGRRGCGESHPQ